MNRHQQVAHELRDASATLSRRFLSGSQHEAATRPCRQVLMYVALVRGRAIAPFLKHLFIGEPS